ncbi:MAG: hypothetical protein JW889_00870, partial [Verrucomicrobia bacterium]|nr:hypothetical protein [Verrucomicrobiota bacterium]
NANGCLSGDGARTYEYDGNVQRCLGRSRRLRHRGTIIRCNDRADRAAENRLVRVKEGETTVAEYEYDPLGRRVRKTVGSAVTRYVYDGQNVIEEHVYDSGWQLDGTYAHGNTACCLDEDSAVVGGPRSF